MGVVILVLGGILAGFVSMTIWHPPPWLAQIWLVVGLPVAGLLLIYQEWKILVLDPLRAREVMTPETKKKILAFLELLHKCREDCLLRDKKDQQTLLELVVESSPGSAMASKAQNCLDTHESLDTLEQMLLIGYLMGIIQPQLESKVWN